MILELLPTPSIEHANGVPFKTYQELTPDQLSRLDKVEIEKYAQALAYLISAQEAYATAVHNSLHGNGSSTREDLADSRNAARVIRERAIRLLASLVTDLTD